MDVHSERDSGIGVAQALRNRNKIAAVGEGDACACMAELMRMKVLDSISLFQLLEISGWSLRIHRLWGRLLRENILADTFGGLLCAELLQQLNHIRANINSSRFAVFWIGKIDTGRLSILKVVTDCDGAGLPVNICPLEAWTL